RDRLAARRRDLGASARRGRRRALRLEQRGDVHRALSDALRRKLARTSPARVPTNAYGTGGQ
ncbi:MAG: hypothetical protein ACK56I_10225, partial [bacterium]